MSCSIMIKVVSRGIEVISASPLPRMRRIDASLA
jgi:hypothetical protein